MSDAETLRDYVLGGRYRTQRILELVEYDDESAVTTGTTRLDALAAVAIDRYEREFGSFDATSTHQKEVASWFVILLLVEDNETQIDEPWVTAIKESLQDERSRKRVSPLASSNYQRSTAPSTAPSFDESFFNDYVAPNPSSDTERGNE